MNHNADTFLRIKRILAFLTSIGLTGVSIWFSKQGFGIESNDQIVWLGWFLGITVNVIQLVFNTSIQKLNPTLKAAGVVAYGYGLYTNWAGLSPILDNGWFAFVVGTFVEVLPEPLFAWAIQVYDGGDVVGNIGELFGGTPVTGSQSSFAPMGFNHNNTVSKYKKPEYPHTSFGKPKQANPSKKVVSNIFNSKYTDRFKK